MTFATYEDSVQDARPVHLIEITVGLTVFDFTSAEREVIFNELGKTFTPAPMHHGQPKVNQDQPGSSVVVRMATSHPSTVSFARAWVARAPNTGDTRVRMWRKHQDDPDEEFRLFWVGYIVSVGYEKDGVITALDCKSLGDLFTLQGPRKNWGTLCNHELYDEECRLSELAFVDNGTVAAVAADGITYTLDGIGAPTVTYVGGELRKPGTLVSGLIVAVNGTDFMVQYPIPDIVPGDTVQVVEGCNHTLTHCAQFPNAAEPSGTNVENFGGSPFTPPVNIFVKGGDAL